MYLFDYLLYLAVALKPNHLARQTSFISVYQAPHCPLLRASAIPVLELSQSQGASSCPTKHSDVLKLAKDPNMLILTDRVTESTSNRILSVAMTPLVILFSIKSDRRVSKFLQKKNVLTAQVREMVRGVVL